MASAVLSFVVVVLCVLSVRGDCETDVIKKIYAIWGGNPPYDIVPQLVGNQTLLYIASFYDQDTLDGLKCFKTEVDLDKVSTTDYFIYSDPKKNKQVYYDMVEEENGIVTNINAGVEDHMYAVYFKHGTFGVYQCGEGYSFLCLSVLNYDPKNLLQAAAVTDATTRLQSLGVKFGPKMDPSKCFNV